MGAVLLALGMLAASAPPARFALVVGHNAPADEGTAPLHYADDDALATHALLQEAGVRAIVLTRPDDDTRRLHPHADHARVPTVRELQRAMETLADEMKAASSPGARVEFLFFYSGHGNVQNGQGYVALEDGRFTRGDLLERVLMVSPAHVNHVIVDACKSYFLAFDKGAGGVRRPAPRGFSQVTADVLARTGFVLSTSSDRDSHEWERFQAGIFSHELRSALRGAADADADGHITYAELGAFLDSANRGIANPRFRPDFLVRPPSRSGAVVDDLKQDVLAWGHGDVLLLDQGGLGHLYLEDAAGLRLADVHAAAGEQRALRLPSTRPLFVRSGDEALEFGVAAPGSTRLSLLVRAPGTLRSKGALHLAFQQLFGVPFAATDVQTFAECQAELAREHEEHARRDRVLRRAIQATSLAGAALGLASTLPALILGGVAAAIAVRDAVPGGVPWSRTRYITARDALARDLFVGAAITGLLLSLALVTASVAAGVVATGWM